MDFWKNWKFDYITAMITALLLPLLFVLRKIFINYLKSWGIYTIEGIMYWVSRIIKHSLAGALTLRKYCRLQLGKENYKYLHVPSKEEIVLDIDRVYVTLTLEKRGSQKQSYNHLDFLMIGNRILVVGEPGSGKSSLIKRLFRDACSKAIKNPLKNQLPILIELKNLTPPSTIKDNKLEVWLYEYLLSEIKKSAVYEMVDCFENYSTTAGLLVLLDGLDEVSSNYYPKIEKAINGLSQKLSQLSDKNVIVLTMRTQFHQQIKSAFRELFPHSTFLKPFTPSDIYEFLARWHFTKEAEKNISRIYKELTDHPTLREMCSNPLILAMYVAEDQAAGSIIAPETRTEFYSKVTEELLINRRLRQKAGSTIAPKQLREQRERILGKLAYNHLLNASESANSLMWSEGLKVVREVSKCKESEAESKLRELARETGLVTEEKQAETFRFIHLTFCEFLAAKEAIEGREDGWSNLINSHFQFKNSPELHLRSRLIELIPFASGLLLRIQRFSALNDITKLNDTRLLARCFLETKQYDHPCWPQFTNNVSQALLSTVEKDWDEEWLRDLHLFNVVIRDAKQSTIHLPSAKITIDLADFFQSLVKRQKESLSKLLSAYATHDAAAVFRLAEISNLDLATDFPDIIISNCDQVPFFAIIREQMLRELNRIGLWASIISEAALRSRVVATMTHKIEPIEELNKYVDGLNNKEKWFEKGLVKESLFTQCLSIAISKNISSQAPLVLVENLREIPSPNSIVWIIKSQFFHFSILVIVMLAAIAILLPQVTSSLQSKETFLSSTKDVFLIGGFFYTIMIAIGFLGMKRQRLSAAYEKMLQIESLSSSARKRRYTQNEFIYKILGKKSYNVILKFVKERESRLAGGYSKPSHEE